MIKKIKRFYSARYERKMIAETKELLEDQIKRGKHFPHYNHAKGERDNVLEMIRFFKIGYEDGYFPDGKGFEVTQWMDSNKEKLLDLYDDLVSNPQR